MSERVDLRAYCERIGYDGPLDPTVETLTKLHQRHRLTVPYENLDITLRRPLMHTPEALFQKIVGRRRGGWCHELNRLFAYVLEQIGFRLTYHNAKVWQTYGGVSPDFSHLVLVVHLAERWIADVGFGARGPLDPLRLDTEEPQPSAGDWYRVGPDPEDGGRRMVAWRPAGGGEWLNMYSMAMAPRPLTDFDGRSAEQQGEENWWGRRVASIATQEGRVSLNHDRLIVTREGARVERVLEEEELPRVLRESFGIELDDGG
ncbi:MAG TPA: arylamine N-acetyltransferase [Chloroflexota bacterium]|nr:arylamine N-acetyltransferase [Chloroflexota bacterium]